MQTRGVLCSIAIGVFTMILGCGSVKPDEPKGYRAAIGEAVKLTGQIVLDGSPPEGLIVSVFNEKNFDYYRQKKTVSGLEHTGFIKPDGTFAFTTYGFADGVPVGNYVLLFRRENGASESKMEAFNSKYGDPENSKFKVTLEAGKPVDMGMIELSEK